MVTPFYRVAFADLVAPLRSGLGGKEVPAPDQEESDGPGGPSLS